MIVTIIIPVYNEQRTIARLIEKVLLADSSPYVKEIIVVDDGSTDGTGDILKQYRDKAGIYILSLPRNCGKASAIKSALSIAAGEIVAVQDADLEYSPDDYQRLLSPFADRSTQAVYGSRFMNSRWPANMQTANWLANRLFTLLVNLLYKSRITDEGTAYKLFRREIITSIDIECSGFEFCPEVTTKLLKRGVRIVEVPVSYAARDKKEGKKPTFRDGLKILWTIVRNRFRD